MVPPSYPTCLLPSKPELGVAPGAVAPGFARIPEPAAPALTACPPPVPPGSSLGLKGDSHPSRYGEPLDGWVSHFSHLEDGHIPGESSCES